MRLADCNWMDIERRLKHDKRIVLVLGATEQHGYLSLSTDSIYAWRVASEACARADVLLAPLLEYGFSSFALGFPGTLSLSAETYGKVLVDLVSCMYRHGFRRVILANGHGGNRICTGAMIDIQTGKPDLRIYLTEPFGYSSAEEQQIAEERGITQGQHAGWSENYPFARVCEVPDKVAPQASYLDLPGVPMNPEVVRRYYPDGVFGGAYTINDDEIMMRLFRLAVERFTSFLEKVPRI